MDGWIKLHRKLIDNPIMKDPELLQLFVYCLLRANHKEKSIFHGNTLIEIGRGEFITGRYEMAEYLEQNPNTLYNRMKKLEKFGFIGLKTNNKFTIVNVHKYDIYQESDEEVSTTDQQQINTDKNGKNDKNVKNNTNKSTAITFPTPEGIKEELWSEYLDLRKKKRSVMTQEAYTRLVAKLQSLANDGEDINKCLQQTNDAGWTGVFPYHGDRNKPRKSGTSDFNREEWILKKTGEIVREKFKDGSYKAIPWPNELKEKHKGDTLWQER